MKSEVKVELTDWICAAANAGASTQTFNQGGGFGSPYGGGFGASGSAANAA
jgi:hypothetical protein